MNSANYYKDTLQSLEQDLKLLKQKSKQWVLIRLVSFAIIPLTVFWMYEQGWVTALLVLVEFIAFLVFVRKSAENKEQIHYTQQLIWINQSELKALEGDYSSFHDGEEFIDPTHAFSYDFDVFGRKSFFQFFNRTVSIDGRELLAQRFLNGASDEKIHHAAIEELKGFTTWTQQFRALGMTLKKQCRNKSLVEWANKEQPAGAWMRWTRFVLPLVALVLTGAYYLELINGLLFVVGALAVLFPITYRLKKTNAIHQELMLFQGKIEAITQQAAALSKVDFESPQLKNYQQLFFKGSQNGFTSLKELKVIMKEIEYRNNILVAVLLNFYLAWDLRMLFKLHQWKTVNHQAIQEWCQILTELEVLISAANFRYNNLETTSYGTLTNSADTSIRLEELGHPLIDGNKRITNNYHLANEQFFSIITGPNMAGKSTFLRSIGINLMLAKAGFPVMAKNFVFPRLNLYSSMRTSDNLTEESSYFHAELIRLRFIMDAIERGEEVFIVLDEILKGTNSKDKEEGSAKFLDKLVKLGAKGVIATHDLKLTEMAEKNPALVNLYFDTTINGEDISFDYTIRKGVAKNMNASFLLKKMKLID